MRSSVELKQEEDGRWVAEVPQLPGVLAYGNSREQATARAKALALRVIADRLEHGGLQLVWLSGFNEVAIPDKAVIGEAF